MLAGKGVTRGGDEVTRQVKESLEHVRIFNAPSSFN